MRKSLIIFLVAGLACLLPAAPASAAVHNGKTGKHVHFSPSGGFSGKSPLIKGYLWIGNERRCRDARNVRVESSALEPDVNNETTNGIGMFQRTFKIVGGSGTKTVKVVCKNVTFYGKFRVYSGSLPNTGFPGALTLAVGLALIAAGGIMLMAARSERLVILAGATGRFGGRARGSDTAATRPR